MNGKKIYYTIYRYLEDLNDLELITQFDTRGDVVEFLGITNKCYLSQAIKEKKLIDNQFIVYVDKD